MHVRIWKTKRGRMLTYELREMIIVVKHVENAGRLGKGLNSVGQAACKECAHYEKKVEKRSQARYLVRSSCYIKGGRKKYLTISDFAKRGGEDINCEWF